MSKKTKKGAGSGTRPLVCQSSERYEQMVREREFLGMSVIDRVIDSFSSLVGLRGRVRLCSDSHSYPKLAGQEADQAQQ